MDMAQSIAPRSDQLNADDLIVGPMTVTITDVTQGTAEQPVNVVTQETPGRPYKPSKSMRRVLVAAWGRDSTAYVGQRLTLFRNKDIKFGSQAVGGIEISHMSGLAEPLKVSLTATRGKKKLHTVLPLTDPAPVDPAPFLTELDTVDSVDTARDLYMRAKAAGVDDTVLTQITDKAKGFA